jgi:hypothetical protein
MRNDSRLFGERSPASPVGRPDEDQRASPSEHPDSRDTIAHGRESHIVHPRSETDRPIEAGRPVTPDDADRA